MNDMNEQEFIALMDRFGPDKNAWPESQRASADQALNQSANLRQVHRNANELHTLIAQDQATPIHAPDELRTQILAQLDAATQADKSADAFLQMAAWLREALWRPVAMAALPCLLGFVLGTVDLSSDTDQDGLSLLVFNGQFEELIDEQ